MRTFNQMWRYAIVGTATNLAFYLIYLAITAFGLDHKVSMSLVYALGIALSFAFNRSWTFGHDGRISSAAARYFIAYLAGYLVNLILLYVFVDRMGFAHQWIQAILIFVVAGLIFLTQKFWVFPRRNLT